jgi:hypothetical protein
LRAESEFQSWPPTVLVRRCHSTDVLPVLLWLDTLVRAVWSAE